MSLTCFRPARALSCLALPLWALTLSALSTFAVSASAAPIADASGLVLDPPAGYQAEALPPSGGNTVRYGMKRAEDTDTGCQAAYMPAPQNASLSQQQINEMMVTSEWRTVGRTILGVIYDVQDGGTFESDGITGMSFVADIRQRDGIPPRAQDVRTLLVMRETPKGRTTVVCVGEKASFEQRRAEFDDVVRSVTPVR